MIKSATLFIRGCLLLALMAITYPSESQCQLFYHYSVKDGLPSDVIYRIFSDSDGFLWIATDHGVCRYDGIGFDVYTTDDGLPDNEVFGVGEDGEHRHWIFGFTQKPCFVLNGKVYNSSNSRLCKQIEDSGELYCNVFRNKAGQYCLGGSRIGVLSGDSLFIPHKELRFYAFSFSYCIYNGIEYVISGPELCRIDNGKKKSLLKKEFRTYFIDNNRIYFFENNYFDGPTFNEGILGIDSVILVRKQPCPAAIYSIYRLSTNQLLCCTERGTMIYDTDKGQLIASNVLPVSASVNTSTFDIDGNRWFSSSTNGLFMQPASRPSIYNKSQGLVDDHVITLGTTSGGKLLAGYDYGDFSIISKQQIINRSLVKQGFRNRIKFIHAETDNQYIIGSDQGVYLFDLLKNKTRKIYSEAVKAGYFAHGSCLIASANTAVAYDLRTDSISLLWKHRTTAIVQTKDSTIWLGTLEGLYYWRDGEINRFESNKLLSNIHIMYLEATEDGSLVIATSKDGIFIKEGTSMQHLTLGSGLSSNNCKKIFIDSHQNIWLCTDGGIDRIIVKHPGKFDIRSYSMSDGLTSGLNNDIAVINDTLYVATNEGIVVLNGYSIKEKLFPLKFWISSVRIGSNVINRPTSVFLSHDQNDLQVHFTCISFSGGKEIQYKYILEGSANDTSFSKISTVNISSLQPGSYRFWVWARVMDQAWSAPQSFIIRIHSPFWTSAWFIGMITVLVGIILYSFNRYKIQRIRNSAEKAVARKRQMAELELQALRAQINPHFLFNALNSIQNYYSNNDEIMANEYLTSFAQFMRKTLTYSKAPWLSLTEEMSMLETYINLEQMRFKHAFVYKLLAEELRTDEIKVPTMLLQPYIENAINHGLRHCTDRRGQLLIIFELKSDILTCIIKDNGIGRQAAAAFKPASHESYGMLINEQRIITINQVYNTQITMIVEDNKGDINGTIITITIPQMSYD